MCGPTDTRGRAPPCDLHYEARTRTRPLWVVLNDDTEPAEWATTPVVALGASTGACLRFRAGPTLSLILGSASRSLIDSRSTARSWKPEPNPTGSPTPATATRPRQPTPDGGIGSCSTPNRRPPARGRPSRDVRCGIRRSTGRRLRTLPVTCPSPCPSSGTWTRRAAPWSELARDRSALCFREVDQADPFAAPAPCQHAGSGRSRVFTRSDPPYPPTT